MRRGFTDTVVYDTAKVKERYGMTPEEFVEFKALKGDPSDNIPGVPGIGEKTASDLICEYGSLEAIYQNLSKIKPALAEKLEKGKKSAFLSRELSQIVTDIPLDFDAAKCNTIDYNRGKVFELFRDLGFKSLLKKIPQEEDTTSFEREQLREKNRVNYQTISNKGDLINLVNKIGSFKKISLHVKTADEDPRSDFCGISLSIKDDEAYYIPVRGNNGLQIPTEDLVSHLKPVLESEIEKIGHNIKNDYIALSGLGINLANISFDTMLGAYLINANARAVSLSELAFSELGIETTDMDDVVGKGRDKKAFDKADIEKATILAAEEADMILRLERSISKDLKNIELDVLMNKIEVPLIPVLAKMERTGIKLDTDLLKDIAKKFGLKITKLEEQIYKQAGTTFNIASPSQLQKILFVNLALQEKIEKKELKKLPSGGYSTGAEELEKLKEVHPIIELIQEYRELTKLKNTYLDTLPTLVDGSGRIHTTFNQAVVATGRLSSSNPNLQNIPIRSDVGQDIRKAFIAEKGYSILSADYSQIELRVIAHIARDNAMIQAFHAGLDIHTATAAEVYGVSEDKVTSTMRRNAKAVNFGIVYGVSPHGLQRSTGMGYDEAKIFIDKYFAIHVEIKEYLVRVVEEAKKNGYAETIFGRRRYLPELESSNFMVKGAAERMAMNMPIQGTAADLIKLAMIEIDNELKGMKSRMLLQVHDELVLEVENGEIEKVKEMVKSRMENVTKLAVPILVEIGIGSNWGEAK
jgi:DNA polymerase-1